MSTSAADRPSVEYGSDLVIELLTSFGVEHFAFNPGASFRGIHDSLVQFDRPHPVLCNQEMIAVAVAHGYAKAANKPMAVGLHNIVGLQQASMAIFNAWCDRAPIMILGGTGPLSVPARRPWIDWIHTAQVQGEQVRHYVKWDDQPFDIASIPESFVRAWTAMTADPPGPVYLCYDVSLQEAELPNAPAVPRPGAVPTPRDPAPDCVALRAVAERLRSARLPVIITDFAGATPSGFDLLVQLAEATGAPVVDRGARHSFPSTHPLNFSVLPEVIADADVIVAIDVDDLFGALLGNAVDQFDDTVVRRNGQWIAHITPQHYKLRSWASDAQRQVPVDELISGSALPTMTALIAEFDERPVEPAALIERSSVTDGRVATAREAWRREALREDIDDCVGVARLAFEVGEALDSSRLDWALANGTLQGWERRLWSMDRPRQRFGNAGGGGGGLGYGMGASIGVSLALGSETMVVNLQSDGDFMFTPSALWTIVAEQLPILTVLHNNRQYGNTVNHALKMAESRGRSSDRVGVGTSLDDPRIDYAAMAASMGMWAKGPITSVDELKSALRDALDEIRAGRPALIDIITPGVETGLATGLM